MALSTIRGWDIDIVAPPIGTHDPKFQLIIYRPLDWSPFGLPSSATGPDGEPGACLPYVNVGTATNTDQWDTGIRSDFDGYIDLYYECKLSDGRKHQETVRVRGTGGGGMETSGTPAKPPSLKSLRTKLPGLAASWLKVYASSILAFIPVTSRKVKKPKKKK